jgi:hypothetical protein
LRIQDTFIQNEVLAFFKLLLNTILVQPEILWRNIQISDFVDDILLFSGLITPDE